MSKRRWVLRITGAIAIFILLAVMVREFSGDVREFIGKSLPKSAFNITYQKFPGFQDSYFFLKFSLKKDDLESFLDDICGAEKSELSPDFLWQAGRQRNWPDWWNPDQDILDIGGRCINLNSNVVTDIFISKVRQDTVNIYLSGFR